MEFSEKIKEMFAEHDKEVKKRAIEEYYVAIENHYKIYKCVPSIGLLESIAEQLKGK